MERREWAKLKAIFKAYKGFRSWEEIRKKFQEPDYRKQIRKLKFLKNVGLLYFCFCTFLLIVNLL